MNEVPNYNPFEEEDWNARKQGDNSLNQMTNYSDLNPMDQGDDSGRTLRLILLIVGVMGCCILAIAGFAYFRPGTQPIIAQFFPSPTATFTSTLTQTSTITPTPTETFTPTPNYTATEIAGQSTGTAIAFQSTATYAVGEWRIVLADTFDSNKNNWLVDTTDDEYAKTTYNITEGKYTWDVTAHKSVISWIRADTRSLEDFYLSVEAKQASRPASADYGLIFREDPDSNFYYFGINDQGQFALFLYNKEWSTLIDWTQTDFILPGEANRITVMGQGSHFTFFINDQYLTEATDDHIKKGTTALATELGNADEQAIFEFDNFELRAPK